MTEQNTGVRRVATQNNMSRKRKLPEMDATSPAHDSFADASDGQLTLLADDADVLCACSEMCGRRNSMEDQHINAVVHARDGSTKLRIFAVCDGHGGSVCARFLSRNLARFVAAQVGSLDAQTDKNRIVSALQEAFRICQADFEKQTNADDSGSTCCLLLYFCKSKLFYIANCGDSRAIVFDQLQTATATGKQVTVDHSPNLPQERERIAKAGGFVVSRYVGPLGTPIHRVNGCISVSRSFGDKFLRPCIVETPDVYGPFQVNKKSNSTVLLACDGAFESNTCSELCCEIERIVNECQSGGASTTNRSDDSQHPSRSILKTQCLAVANGARKFAYRCGSEDNITTMCIHFIV